MDNPHEQIQAITATFNTLLRTAEQHEWTLPEIRACLAHLCELTDAYGLVLCHLEHQINQQITADNPPDTFNNAVMHLAHGITTLDTARVLISDAQYHLLKTEPSPRTA